MYTNKILKRQLELIILKSILKNVEIKSFLGKKHQVVYKDGNKVGKRKSEYLLANHHAYLQLKMNINSSYGMFGPININYKKELS